MWETPKKFIDSSLHACSKSTIEMLQKELKFLLQL